MRKRVNRHIDRRVFSYTAKPTKKINVNATISRGGIRL